MKKNIFFQLGIFVSLLIPITSIFGQIVPKFGSVQLTYPIDNSVFSVPSMSPVGTEGTLMALVYVLRDKFTTVKAIRKKLR